MRNLIGRRVGRYPREIWGRGGGSRRVDRFRRVRMLGLKLCRWHLHSRFRGWFEVSMWRGKLVWRKGLVELWLTPWDFLIEHSFYGETLVAGLSWRRMDGAAVEGPEGCIHDKRPLLWCELAGEASTPHCSPLLGQPYKGSIIILSEKTSLIVSIILILVTMYLPTLFNIH